MRKMITETTLASMTETATSKSHIYKYKIIYEFQFRATSTFITMFICNNNVYYIYSIVSGN